jgi:hypothetical protein
LVIRKFYSDVVVKGAKKFVIMAEITFFEGSNPDENYAKMSFELFWGFFYNFQNEIKSIFFS